MKCPDLHRKEIMFVSPNHALDEVGVEDINFLEEIFL